MTAQSVSTKILVILAVWCLSGGLAFADTFDLSDELQRALIDQVMTMEADFDELRESMDDGVVPQAYLATTIARRTVHSVTVPRSFALLVLPPNRLLHEVLRTFRI